LRRTRSLAPGRTLSVNGAMERVRRKLRAASDGDRQMVEVLAAVLDDGLPAAEAGCAEALGEGVHSADLRHCRSDQWRANGSLLNILARRREPAPAETIMTPEALRLRCEPAADCARYDSLRRAAR